MSRKINCPACSAPLIIPETAALPVIIRCPFCSHESKADQVAIAKYEASLKLDTESPIISDSPSSPQAISASDSKDQMANIELSERKKSFDFGERAEVPQQVAVGPPVDYDKASPSSMTKRRKKRRRSGLGFIFGAISSGIIGLSLGYLILLWLQGPDGDFLKIAHKLPAWAVPKSFADDQKVADLKEKMPAGQGANIPDNEQTPQTPQARPSRGMDVNTPVNGNRQPSNAPTTNQPDTAKHEPSVQPADLPSENEIGFKEKRVATLPELIEAIAAAKKVQQDFINGDLFSGDKQMARAKGNSYKVFCKLAKVLMHAQETADRMTEEGSIDRQKFDEKISVAKKLIRETFTANEKRLKETDYISRLWYLKKTRSSTELQKGSGIILVGRVARITYFGRKKIPSVSSRRLDLGGSPYCDVIAKQGPNIRSNDGVFLFGEILKSPYSQLRNFQYIRFASIPAVYTNEIIVLPKE